jgi:hypothetical protein
MAKQKITIAFLLLVALGTMLLVQTAYAKPYLSESQLSGQGLKIISEAYNDDYWIPQFNGSYSTLELTICNVSAEGFPMFHDAEHVTFATNTPPCNEGDEFPSMHFHIAGGIAKFDGIKFLQGVNITASVSLLYFPVSYQTGERDQKWKSDPYLDGDKLYLFSGSGNMIQSSIRMTDSNPDTNKFVGFGDLTGVYNTKSAADQTDFYCFVDGQGYANFYAQYAPDGYDNAAFTETYSHLEHISLDIDSAPSSNTHSSSFIGVLNGAKPLLDNITINQHLEAEYMPVSYQTGTYDQKWDVEPSFDGERLKLFSGSGNMIRNSIIMTDSNSDTNKFVGFGDLTGIYDLQSSASETDFYCSVDGVGYADFYVQYAPSVYDDTTFIDTYSHCEHLTLDTNASPNKGSYDSSFVGVMNGMKPLLPGIDFAENLDVEYMPTSYAGTDQTYDQKWNVNPSFNDNRLYLFSGSGNLKSNVIKITDSNPDTNKFVGFGDLTGVYNILSSVNQTNFVSNANGIGYADFYVQYAPDGYADTSFIDGYSYCEHLRLETKASPTGSSYDSSFIGVLNGAKPLPFPDIDINESFMLGYSRVGCFDSRWFVSPAKLDNNIVIINNGTGILDIDELSIADNNPDTDEILGITGLSSDLYSSDFYSSLSTDNLTWLDADIHTFHAVVNEETGLYIAYGD